MMRADHPCAKTRRLISEQPRTNASPNVASRHERSAAQVGTVGAKVEARTGHIGARVQIAGTAVKAGIRRKKRTAAKVGNESIAVEARIERITVAARNEDPSDDAVARAAAARTIEVVLPARGIAGATVVGARVAIEKWTVLDPRPPLLIAIVETRRPARGTGNHPWTVTPPAAVADHGPVLARNRLARNAILARNAVEIVLALARALETGRIAAEKSTPQINEAIQSCRTGYLLLLV